MNSNQINLSAVETKVTSLSQVPLPSELPPVLLTCFTRPDVLKPVLDMLRQQTVKPERIIAYIDKGRDEEEVCLTQECTQLVNNLADEFAVEIFQREQNMGCDLNTIDALNCSCNRFPMIILLEDDDLPNKYFYELMCKLLVYYEPHKHIFGINGYAPTFRGIEDIVREDYFLSQRFFSWGWATWADRWLSLDTDKIKQSDNPFGKFYDIPLTRQSKITMVNQYYIERGKGTDWVITTTLACLSRGYYTVAPLKSFVKNIGFGHERAESYKGGSTPSWVNPDYHPDNCPQILPSSLEPIPEISRVFTPLETLEVIKENRLYLRLNEAKALFSKDYSLKFKVNLIKLVISQQLNRRFAKRKS